MEPWAIVAVGATTVAGLLAPLQVNDLAYHVRVGEWMWAAHRVARTDTLTYTVFGQPWIDQQWGAQLLLSLVYSAGGWKTLIVLRALVVGACFGATFLIARSNGSSALVAGVCTMAGFIAAALVPGALALRPQLLALPLFVFSAWVIHSRADHARRLFVLPLIAVVWANVHGSFPLLTVMLLIALIQDVVTKAPKLRPILALTIASILAPLLSPFGFGVYRYVWDVTTSPVVRQLITEWAPLYDRAIPGVAFLGLVLIGGVACSRPGVRRPTIEEGLSLVLFTGLAAWSGRNILWWSVLVPPIVAGLLVDRYVGSAWSRRATAVCVVLLSAGACLGLSFVITRPTASLLTEAPPGVTTALAEMPSDQGRVFNEWWGSWFEFALPDQLMFTDARVEIFPSSIWRDYDTVVNAGPGWRDVLARWNVSIVVLDSRHDVPLTQALAADPQWVRTFEDADGVIFQRVGT